MSLNKNTERVQHPSHYNREGAMECIEEMIKLAETRVIPWEYVEGFCFLNVWKYRDRALDKAGLEDMKKSDFYMKAFLDIQQKKADWLERELDKPLKVMKLGEPLTEGLPQFFARRGANNGR